MSENDPDPYEPGEGRIQVWHKRRADPEVKVHVTFECGQRITLRVQDSGRPIPAEVMRGLLKGPVTSETGYGIGLYQVAVFKCCCHVLQICTDGDVIPVS